MRGAVAVALAVILTAPSAVSDDAADLNSGVVAAFSGGGKRDFVVLPNLALHLPKNEAATPFWQRRNGWS